MGCQGMNTHISRVPIWEFIFLLSPACKRKTPSQGLESLVLLRSHIPCVSVSLSSAYGKGKHSRTGHASWSNKVRIDLGIPTGLRGVSLGKLMRMTLKNCLFRRKIWPGGFQLVCFLFPSPEDWQRHQRRKAWFEEETGPPNPLIFLEAT